MVAMSLTIALDAMGGDAAPGIVVAGAALALEQQPDLRFLLFGDDPQLEPLLAAQPRLRAPLRAAPHARTRSPATPSRRWPCARAATSSMRLAINAVKEGEAAAAVSAGNTGALMAMAKFVLKTLPGIDRPAIASVMPARRRPVVVLDLGANVECSAEHLFQFAVMGEVFARVMLGVAKPRVGLLNVGTEELKGDDVVRGAAAHAARQRAADRLPRLRRGHRRHRGRGRRRGHRRLHRQRGAEDRRGHRRPCSPPPCARRSAAAAGAAKLGYLLAKPAFATLRNKFDPRRYNGAMFLGLNGVVVKSHGGTDALGFAAAIAVAADLVRKRTNERIIEEMGGTSPVPLGAQRTPTAS